MRGHYLKPNHRTETIHQAVWVDTETDEVRIDALETGHVLRRGWAAFASWSKRCGWSTPEWFAFEEADSFWDWVETKTRPKSKLYVFCHNSNFDYPVLDAFRKLPARGWVAEKVIADAPPTMVQCRRATASLMLLDTLNWWRVPLKALGDSVGLPKLDMPPLTASRQAWDTYNRRDVEIIMRAVMLWCDFLRDHDLGGFAPTLASQAMRAYRHRFMDHPILIDNNKDALECSRECYHGGRTEAWFIGHTTQRLHLLDVNSMYPFVMQAEAYPSQLAYYTCRTDARDLVQMLKRYLVCARVRVRVDEPALPVVHDRRLVFPVGEFDAALSTPQLKWALAHGEIVRVHDIAMYTAAPIFERFIAELYAERLKARAAGNEVLAWLIKILMNSLYGKWGQRGMHFEEIDRTDDLNPRAWSEVDYYTKEVSHFRQLMGVVMEKSTRPESSGSHPAIAAHVTAYASMYLWELAAKAGRSQVFYMDTDSLLVTDTGLERLRPLMDNTRLGGLKLEGTYTDVDIRGAKDYRFGNRHKVKGVRSSAIWTGPNTVSQTKWSGLRGMIRNGAVDMPVTRQIEKHLSRDYLKGTTGPDGRVSPLVFPLD